MPRNPLQETFIAHCRDNHFSLSFVMGRLGIDGATLSRWLASTRFRRRVALAMKTLARRRELELAMNANRAAERLTRIGAGQFNRKTPPLDVERLACFNSVVMARSWPPKLTEAAKRSKSARRADSAEQSDRDLAHPDIADHADALLKELELSREQG
jgi:hypothetical protein